MRPRRFRRIARLYEGVHCSTILSLFFMSYSDYGAFAFSLKKGGKWQRDKNLEDRTLLAGREDDLTLQNAFGLKLDVVRHAQEAQDAHPELTDTQKWNWYNCHHAILGQFDGMAILCYKKPVVVLWMGEKIAGTTWESKPTDPPLIIEKDGWKSRVETHEDYSFAMLVSPDGDESAAFTNYGLGDNHWWQDSDGFEQDIDFDTMESNGRKDGGAHYQREAYFMNILSTSFF